MKAHRDFAGETRNRRSPRRAPAHGDKCSSGPPHRSGEHRHNEREGERAVLCRARSGNAGPIEARTSPAPTNTAHKVRRIACRPAYAVGTAQLGDVRPRGRPRLEHRIVKSRPRFSPFFFPIGLTKLPPTIAGDDPQRCWQHGKGRLIAHCRLSLSEVRPDHNNRACCKEGVAEPSRAKSQQEAPIATASVISIR
jgi:hypothetical protein